MVGAVMCTDADDDAAAMLLTATYVLEWMVMDEAEIERAAATLKHRTLTQLAAWPGLTAWLSTLGWLSVSGNLRILPSV